MKKHTFFLHVGEQALHDDRKRRLGELPNIIGVFRFEYHEYLLGIQGAIMLFKVVIQDIEVLPIYHEDIDGLNESLRRQQSIHDHLLRLLGEQELSCFEDEFLGVVAAEQTGQLEIVEAVSLDGFYLKDFDKVIEETKSTQIRLAKRAIGLQKDVLALVGLLKKLRNQLRRRDVILPNASDTFLNKILVVSVKSSIRCEESMQSCGFSGLLEGQSFPIQTAFASLFIQIYYCAFNYKQSPFHQIYWDNHTTTQAFIWSASSSYSKSFLRHHATTSGFNTLFCPREWVPFPVIMVKQTVLWPFPLIILALTFGLSS